MIDILEQAIKQASYASGDYVELRYHSRMSRSFVAHKQRVDVAHTSHSSGLAVRVLMDGFWGFSSTTGQDLAAVQKAIEQARVSSRLVKAHATAAGVSLQDVPRHKADYLGPGYNELWAMDPKDKLAAIVNYERQLAAQSSKIHTAKCRYGEIFEDKWIVTSDGAEIHMRIALPEISFSAIAEDHGKQSSAGRGAGVNGDWDCLFRHPSLDHVIDDVAKLSVDLISADHPEGGLKNCILDPAVVGLLCHEAIGHTVEADFVKSGSVAQGKIGHMVASPLVSMADTGCEQIAGYAVGNMPFDDEGVPTETTDIIKEGRLVSYLHNRETAKEFGTKATGNARAWSFEDEPLIRMRNTFLRPGKDKLKNMIAEMDDGYLCEGAGSGQADSNGEFMFGTSHVWEIKNGKKTKLLKEATLSGIAFDVLKTVDAVSEEFRWDLGTGYCGKGQPAKVDAGGPYVRCKIHVGGR